MITPKPLHLLATLFFGLSGFLSAPRLIAQEPITEGNLTVTVRELANGGVRISLSGSAPVLGYPNNSEDVMNNGALITRTNVAFDPAAPPALAGDLSLPIPPGLTLTIDYGEGTSSEEETRSGFLPVSEISVPLDEVVFPSGNWCLGSFEIGAPAEGAAINGSGAVTANDVPFHLFVPGIYRVGPPTYQIPTEGGTELEYFPGQDEYFITYEVIPFVPAPAIRLSKPSRFPATKVRRPARDQDVTITNAGNLPLTNLSLDISGVAAKDFSLSAPLAGILDSGESIRIPVGFRPHRRGIRRATLTVAGMTELKQVDPASEEEAEVENGLIEPVSPIVVTDSVALEGSGVRPKVRPSKPRSPRFPHGPAGMSN
jgi:hypothetical protein